jgi:hypothetical protein
MLGAIALFGLIGERSIAIMTDGFSSPNYTQVPNDWFDKYLPLMDLPEAKVTGVLIRWTFGYHRHAVSLSLVQLKRLTGLSEGGVMIGAAAAESRGLIRRANRGAGDRRRTRWEVIVTTSPGEVVTPDTTSPEEVALPHPVRQTTSPGEVHLNKLKQTRNKTTATAKAAPAAAAAAHGEWWCLDVLAAASKLPGKRRLEILEANPSPGAFVSKYLYALSQPGINRPPLWVASQVIDNPGAWEGDPFETLAGLGPAGLAHVLTWIRDDASIPLDINGASGTALAFRGELKERHRKDPARLYSFVAAAIADLGLGSIAQPAPAADAYEPEPAPPAAPRDAWQEMLSHERPNLGGPAYDRLLRCELVSSGGGRLVLAAPTKAEYDWLKLKMGRALAERFSADLILREE